METEDRMSINLLCTHFSLPFLQRKKKLSKKYTQNDVKRKQFNLKLKSSVFLNTLLYVPGITLFAYTTNLCATERKTVVQTQRVV